MYASLPAHLLSFIRSSCQPTLLTHTLTCSLMNIGGIFIYPPIHLCNYPSIHQVILPVLLPRCGACFSQGDSPPPSPYPFSPPSPFAYIIPLRDSPPVDLSVCINPHERFVLCYILRVVYCVFVLCSVMLCVLLCCVLCVGACMNLLVLPVCVAANRARVVQRFLRGRWAQVGYELLYKRKHYRLLIHHSMHPLILSNTPPPTLQCTFAHTLAHSNTPSHHLTRPPTHILNYSHTPFNTTSHTLSSTPSHLLSQVRLVPLHLGPAVGHL